MVCALSRSIVQRDAEHESRLEHAAHREPDIMHHLFTRAKLFPRQEGEASRCSSKMS